MSFETNLDIYGIREALAELREVSPKARRQATQQVKAAASGLLAPARAQYPAAVKLKGWSRKGRVGYDGAKVAQGVQVLVGGRTPKGADRFPIVTIVQKNAGGALFSLAGMEQGKFSVKGKDRLGRPYTRAQSVAFMNKLNAEHAKAQRGLWKARKEISDLAGEEILVALDKVASSVNRKLVPNTPEVKSAIRGYRFDITKPDAPSEWY